MIFILQLPMPQV